MKIFSRLLLTAFLAGLAAGLALTLAQRWLLPILLDAENYLVAARSADSFEIIYSLGRQRAIVLASGNVLFGIGFSLLLAAAMTLRGSNGLLCGLLWGLAGYVIFSALPAVTLGAGLPGQALADLAQRQWWWLFSVSSSSVGLAFLAFSGIRWLKLLGILLALLPLVVGAPVTVGENLIPHDLAHRFVLTRHLVNAVFWVVLGMLSGYLLDFRATAAPLNKTQTSSHEIT